MNAKHTVHVVCLTFKAGDHQGCEDCGGKGWIAVPVREEVKHPVSECCGAPYEVAIGKVWSCSKCGAKIERIEAVGW